MTDQSGTGESLYRKEPKIYPRQVKGRFARLRVIAVWVLLGLFYLLPWIEIGGKQSVLFDLPAPGFCIPGVADDYGRFVFVLFHCTGGALVVWVCLPADGLD